MKSYADYSYWLETSGDDLAPRPPMSGSTDVDVAILGAGYSGLWTAYYLLKRKPSLKIAILEQHIAGFGASGRNGAKCNPGLSLGPGELARRYGYDAARAIQKAMWSSMEEIRSITEDAGIDIEWVKGGNLQVALGPHQVPLIENLYRSYEQLELEDNFQLLEGV